ncbi:MAG TPA: hypothetical protein VIO35_08970, partial [Chloroflexota bacterium]
LYTVAAQPPQTIGKAVRTLAATQHHFDYPSLVGKIFPIAETQKAFALMEDAVDKPVKVAVRGRG